MMAALIRVISNLDYPILYRVRARSGTQAVDPRASYIGSCLFEDEGVNEIRPKKVATNSYDFIVCTHVVDVKE